VTWAILPIASPAAHLNNGSVDVMADIIKTFAAFRTSEPPNDRFTSAKPDKHRTSASPANILWN